jgi:hypothetical protein
MANQILSEEFLRMQKLAGIVTEDQLNENIEQFEDMEDPSLDDVLSKEDLMNKLNSIFDTEDMSNLSFFQKIIITAVKKQIISKIKKGEIQTRAELKAALEKGSV